MIHLKQNTNIDTTNNYQPDTNLNSFAMLKTKSTRLGTTHTFEQIVLIVH